MVTQNMVSCLPKVLSPDRVCRGCVLGKHHKAPFNSGKASCVQKPLDLVHSDICNKKPLLASVMYILTFINELSRFTWVYFLNNKSHVFERSRNLEHLLRSNVVDLLSV